MPLFKRLGLGSVLGYLAAGAFIGPSGLGLIKEVEATLHFAEFGVVLLLFLIGLELQPSRLWAMRGRVFGLGGLQVGLTAAAIALLALALGADRNTALVAGLGLTGQEARDALRVFTDYDEEALRRMATLRDDEAALIAGPRSTDSSSSGSSRKTRRFSIAPGPAA